MNKPGNGLLLPRSMSMGRRDFLKRTAAAGVRRGPGDASARPECQDQDPAGVVDVERTGPRRRLAGDPREIPRRTERRLHRGSRRAVQRIHQQHADPVPVREDQRRLFHTTPDLVVRLLRGGHLEPLQDIVDKLGIGDKLSAAHDHLRIDGKVHGLDIVR